MLYCLFFTLLLSPAFTWAFSRFCQAPNLKRAMSIVELSSFSGIDCFSPRLFLGTSTCFADARTLPFCHGLADLMWLVGEMRQPLGVFHILISPPPFDVLPPWSRAYCRIFWFFFFPPFFSFGRRPFPVGNNSITLNLPPVLCFV